MARHRTQHTGLLGPVTQTRAPALVEGVRQRGGPVIPPACPGCGATGLMWVRNDHMGACRACGADFYRTAYTLPERRPA